MKPHFILPVLAAAGILGIANQSLLAQTTIFNDTFGNGSTIQTAPSTPTANSTTYEIFQQGGTPANFSIGAGDLHFSGRNTQSVLTEAQALFTSSPVTLGTIGDSLNLSITFTDTASIFPSGAPSTLNIGLYNSHSSPPVTGVRLDSTGSGTGGAIGWDGYVARIGGTGGANSAIFTRPPQGPSTNPNQSQDVLFNGASGSGSYTNPTGMLVATTGGQLASGLTQASTYTLSYTITLTGAGTLTISNALIDSGNTVLLSQIGKTSASIETTFDALGFGWRYNNPPPGVTAASSADISSIIVSDNISPVPEPSIFAIAGLAAAGLMRRRLRRRTFEEKP